MSARLTVIGCRAGAPAAGSAASGYLLQAGGRSILIDCGPGVVLQLAQDGLIDQLDAVLISHRHADHCADLLALAYYRRFPQPQAALPLFGPPDLQDILSGLDRLFGIASLPELATPLESAFAFTAVTPGSSFDVAGLSIDTLPMQHPVPTMAFRIPALGLVYTADGALSPPLIAFAQGSACLIAEATYLAADGNDLAEHGHMTAGQAGELAEAAAAEQLLLSHFADLAERSEAFRAAAAVFSGRILTARPGLQIALSGSIQ